MKKAKIYYFTLTDEQRKEEKLEWLKNTKFKKIPFELITPSKKNNWLNLADTDFEELMPICSKEAKAGKDEKAIFKLYANAPLSARDEWVYDFDEDNLKNKTEFFVDNYNDLLSQNDKSWKTVIKWSESLKSLFKRNIALIFNKELITKSNYRPYVKQFYYADKSLNDRLTQNHYDIFGFGQKKAKN
ncbi:type ISP restriction/modification enzyme [Bernardetia sp. OM2101]|uniref:type ISP restriction/modification enzyme n=1 Tax=Bernardetia sp. OM2101 TaxID=3344876 RepID=UPI0035D0BE21